MRSLLLFYRESKERTSDCVETKLLTSSIGKNPVATVYSSVQVQLMPVDREWPFRADLLSRLLAAIAPTLVDHARRFTSSNALLRLRAMLRRFLKGRYTSLSLPRA